MIKKLFAVTKKECVPESPDNPMNQETLLPGHLYLLVLKVSIFLLKYYKLHVYSVYVGLYTCIHTEFNFIILFQIHMNAL